MIVRSYLDKGTSVLLDYVAANAASVIVQKRSQRSRLSWESDIGAARIDKADRACRQDKRYLCCTNDCQADPS